MAKKSTKRKRRAAAPSPREQETRDRIAEGKRVIRQLRELRRVYVQVARRYDAIKANALAIARGLCDGTDYGVYDRGELRRLLNAQYQQTIESGVPVAPSDATHADLGGSGR